jgi:polar amino acid transport system substrate-binding protein
MTASNHVDSRRHMPGRRRVLAGGAALAVLAAAPARAQQCQPRLAPPALIRERTLVMSINPTLPPLQFVNERGELQGMRVELGNKIAETLCLQPEYVRIDFAAMIPGLAARRWDMINTGIFFTEERSRLMYMVPYEQVALSIVVARGNPLAIREVNDLAGRRLSVEIGGIEERRAREIGEQLTQRGLRPLEVRTFDNFAAAFQALRAGQVDSAIALDATAMFQQQRGDFTRAISGLFGQVACFAFRDKSLAEAVAGALNDLKRSGTYDELFDRYGVTKHPEPTFAIRGTGPG